MNSMIESLRCSLIVSCQAYPGEPMRDPATMAQVAASVVLGGAAAVRVQGLEDIRAAKNAVEVPVIGIWKDGEQGVFITPTLDHALAVIDAGADILALDATDRPRPDGRSFTQTVEAIRTTWQGPIMADCDSPASARTALQAGCEIIGTTLAGYTGARTKTDGPDLDLIADVAAIMGHHPSSLLVAEGRVHTPTQARSARTAGAHAVVVGTAITHPSTITGWFRTAVDDT